VKAMNSQQAWGSAFQTRNSAAGFTSTPQGAELHEVLEFHDGERVITDSGQPDPGPDRHEPREPPQIPFSRVPALDGRDQAACGDRGDRADRTAPLRRCPRSVPSAGTTRR
jgi:hypothetical protein